ncbi:MAG: AAA family ATPase [Duncaniella sp.]|nr:AAA family ATPase [Duncaniella sp.]
MAEQINIFKRKLYSRILQWKEQSNGRTALLIEGARRVGKSTLAEEFARNEYESYLLLDFSKASARVNALFNDISDLDTLFMQLQFEFHVRLTPRKSVIIFDEVQFNPRARQAIKHLVADGRFDYIETGSLISISKNVKDILIPSEEESISMYPLDFEEFRWALGDTATPELLREAIKRGKPLGDVAHRQLMRDFRLYMLVGGMPQAVNEYINTLNLSSVDRIKRNIIRLYESDFRKIDNSGRIGRLFDDIPAQLSRNISRYMPHSLLGNLTKEKEDSFISELAASMTVNVCYHTTDPSNGLAMDYDKDYFKLFVGDTGLFVTLAFKDKEFTENIIYQKLLSDKLEANLGYLYENVVAQILTATGRKLFYYTFPTDKSRHLYEVDFLISDKDKIDPIEVKSSGYKAHASLDAFCQKYSGKIKTPFIVYTKDMTKEGIIRYLPVYMLPFIDEIL